MAQEKNEAGTPMLTAELTATEPKYVDTPKGLSTTQGQFTALFSVIALGLSALFGWSLSSDNIESWLTVANNIALIIGPILATMGVLSTFINSQGKKESNTIWANASIEATNLAGIPGLGRILGGKNWKDPERYGNILDILKTVGVPGASQVDSVLESINDPKTEEFQDAVLKALQALDERLDRLEGK